MATDDGYGLPGSRPIVERLRRRQILPPGDGGGGVLDGSFYGETCIPKGYVLDHWMKNFTFVDFIIDRALSPQNVIVVAKPLKTR